MAAGVDVRHQNLGTILSLLHRLGPQSRSALTQATGLNRSTIGILVSRLEELGLVCETDPNTHLRAGRPSPVVSLDESVGIIAVNPEVDAITVGIVGIDAKLQSRIRYPMDHLPTSADVVDAIRSSIGVEEKTKGLTRILAIGIAVPGLVRTNDGVVMLAPHLGWVEVPLGKEVFDSIGLPTLVANDASLGVNAEHVFGAGQGIEDLIYLNGGASGIGGGIVAGGVQFDGHAGYAGELGHTLVNPDGVKCRCGAVGCLETEVNHSKLLEVLELKDADWEEMDSRIRNSKEDRVRNEVNRQLILLAITLGNAINMFNPQRIVLGGFLASLLAVNPKLLRTEVSGHALAVANKGVDIIGASLGSQLLMIGAANMVFQNLVEDPDSVIWMDSEVEGSANV